MHKNFWSTGFLFRQKKILSWLSEVEGRTGRRTKRGEMIFSVKKNALTRFELFEMTLIAIVEKWNT